MANQSLEIPASLEELARVHDWANSILAPLDIPSPLQFNMLLALSESVSNAIRHGCLENNMKKVTVNCRTEPGSIKFSVQDTGKGFTPDELQDPTVGEALLRPGGRGIFLIRQLASDVHFDKTNDGMTVTFQFAWQ